MANKKISDLTATAGLALTHLFETESAGGSSEKATLKQLLSEPIIEKKDLSGLNTYTFSSIPADFTDLELTIFGRSTVAALIDSPSVRLNGLSTAIYDIQRQYAQAGTQSGDQFLAQTSWANINGIAGASVTDTPVPGHIRMTILGYAQTDFYKSMQFQGRQPNNATSGNGYQVSGTGVVRTTAAITSLTVALPSANFVTGSYAMLRGIL